MAEPDWIARVAGGYREGRPLVLLFDFDGTLTPPAPHPSLAVLPEATRELLAELAALPGVTVAVMSGRALAQLRELVGLPGLVYAGSGGMHLDLAGGELADPAAEEFDRIADELAVAVAEPVRWFPGAWVERTPGCLTVHHAALSPLKAACLREEVRDVIAFLAEAAPPLRVREVAGAVEVALAGAWTKADAADRVLARLGPGALPVFAGGVPTDAGPVARVNARGGVTVGVGPDASEAVAVRLPDQPAFAADLARLRTELGRLAPAPVFHVARDA